MTTRAETIANHLRQIRGLSASDARYLYLAFLECLGGAECALPLAEAARAESFRAIADRAGPPPVGALASSKSVRRGDHDVALRDADSCQATSPGIGWECTRLSGHTGEHAAYCGEGDSVEDEPSCVWSDPAAEDISATLRREECERKAARQAVPAGWVVRQTIYWTGYGWSTRASGERRFPTEQEAREHGWGAPITILPVDAAGNVIEPAGVAWEASRSYEEAERLRAELATWKRTAEQRMERIRSVKAERDDRSARCDAAETDVARLTKERDTARAERDAAKAERDKLTTDEADLRYALRTIASLVGGAVALGASTEMHCKVADEVRAVVGQPGKVPDAVQLAVRANIADDRLAVHDERLDNVHARLAVIEHRAPVVRDHSEVIAQCEEALRLCSLRGKDDALLAALAALRGAP